MQYNENEESDPLSYLTHSKKTALAIELAEALNDKDALSLYVAFTHKYPETLLRATLSKVLLIPEHKIRRTRGAYFNYLIQQYERNQYYNRSRD